MLQIKLDILYLRQCFFVILSHDTEKKIPHIDSVIYESLFFDDAFNEASSKRCLLLLLILFSLCLLLAETKTTSEIEGALGK